MDGLLPGSATDQRSAAHRITRRTLTPTARAQLHAEKRARKSARHQSNHATPGPGAYSFSLAATSSNHSPTARSVSSSSFRSLSAQRPKPERSGDPGAYDPQHPKTVAASSRSYLQRLSASQRSRTRSGDESEPWPARPSLWMGEEAAYCA